MTATERRQLDADTAAESALINLAALRRACKLTQAQLAQRLKTSQTNVARLEAAKGATFKSVVKVAQALGLQVSISRNGQPLWPVAS